VESVATEATERAKSIIALREKWQMKLAGQGRSSGNLHRALDVLFKQPIITIAKLAETMDITFPTSTALIERLCKLGALAEGTGFKRNRRFEYKPYLALFEDVNSRKKSSSLDRVRTAY
jgi:Fic family protein